VCSPQVTWDPNEVYDLRGAGCEMKDGKEQCYMIDAQGRENCPASITSQSLAFPGSEYSMCQPAHAKDYYCTIACQDGNEVVSNLKSSFLASLISLFVCRCGGASTRSDTVSARRTLAIVRHVHQVYSMLASESLNHYFARLRSDSKVGVQTHRVV
jgi:hypothetical protein